MITQSHSPNAVKNFCHPLLPESIQPDSFVTCIIFTYFEDWECSTAGQEVEVVDTLLQIVVGSTLQLVGVGVECQNQYC